MSFDVSQTDVLVVGAGPTGLVMACELAARGVPCRVIDRAPVRSDKSRALVVHARTLELFQKLGIAHELIACGRRTVKIRGFVERRRAFATEFGDIGVEDTPYPFLLFVSQAATERLLEEHLLRVGGRVERPVELLGFTQDEAQGVVEARLRHGDGGREERVRARYIVGCDGAHSAVRKGAGLAFEGAPYPQDFVLADVEIDWAEGHDELMFMLSRRAFVVLFPLGGTLVRLVASRAQGVADTAGDPTLAEMQQRFDEVSPAPGRLHEPRWLARFRLHHRGVDRYRAGRVFVAGDAAHIHSPAGGQGMNTGIQDAFNLAWKLALVLQGRGDDALLDSYHAERHPVGRWLLRSTDRIFAAATSRRPFARFARTVLAPRLVPRVLAHRAGRAFAFRFVSQLGIAYRRSPIVAAHESDARGARFHGGPRAGERAPDGPLRAPAEGVAGDGAQAGSTTLATTLFEQLTGTSHHVLVFDDAAARVDDAALAGLERRDGELLRVHRLTGATRELRARYGLRGAGYYLVRPDGYVAFRAAGADIGPLMAYLQRTFPRA